MVIEIIVMILCVTVFIAGGIMVTMNSAGQISPALQLPMPLYYVGLPICNVLTLIYSADRLIRFAEQLKEDINGTFCGFNAGHRILSDAGIFRTRIYSIIASALITIIAFRTPPSGMFVSAQKIVGGMDSFTLLAVRSSFWQVS